MATWEGFVLLKLKGAFAGGLTKPQKDFVKAAFVPALLSLVSPLATEKARYRLSVRLSDNEREVMAGALWTKKPTRALASNAIRSAMVDAARVLAASLGITVNAALGSIFPGVTTATLGAALDGAFGLNVFQTEEEDTIKVSRGLAKAYLRENRKSWTKPLVAREQDFLTSITGAMQSQGYTPPSDLLQRLYNKD